MTADPPARAILPELHDILAAYDASRARSIQKTIGPSEIGEPCDRALAYRLARIPPAAPGEAQLKWAPLVGTFIHEGIADALEEANRALGRERWLVERRVTVSPELDVHGVTDAYDFDEDEVIDWKAVGKTRLQHYRRHGPGDQYRIQAHLYGRGWELSGFTPRRVRVVFLAKWSHVLTDSWEWSEPYDRATALAALERLDRLGRLVEALDVDTDPSAFALIRATPGSDGCKYCNWYRPWPGPDGPADTTGCPGVPVLRKTT